MKELPKSNLLFALSLVIFAVVFSEVLVYFQIKYYWGFEYSEIGFSLGFWTSLIDSIFVVAIIFYIKSFYEKNLEQKNKLLKEHSIIDDLTTTFNRNYFKQIFPKTLNSAKRTNERIALLLIDIDDLKIFNETFGHDQGDKAIEKIGLTIKNTLLRADDLSFRIEGKRFAVIIKVDSDEKAVSVAEIIRKNVESLKIIQSDKNSNSHITVSIGLIFDFAQNIKDENELYNKAERALYLAKSNGKNRIINS